MKNSADLGGCYPPRRSASVDNILLYLQNSSYPTQPHSIIAKYKISDWIDWITERRLLLYICKTFLPDGCENNILKLINNSSSLNRGNQDRDGV